MKTIAVLGRKGGTGKTTLAIHLSVEAERQGHTTALIDLDPQASAAKWGDNRGEQAPAIISTPVSRLPQILDIAKSNGATLAVLDTAPHAESATLYAARAAQLAVIPCKPALIDLQEVGVTLDMVDLAKVPAQVVLNGVPSRGPLENQARQALEDFGVACAPCTIGQRMAFVHSYNAGLVVQEFEPRGKASSEIRELYSYIATEIGE